jgi:hypothetical protein
MTATFTHESGAPRYEVPGYFAADGDAANTSATAGNKWRVHVSPDKVGRWNWRLSFVSGPGVATSAAAGQPVASLDGATGSFEVMASNKSAPDFRAKGRLQYVGKHYLRFAGNGEYFLKAGADAPETVACLSGLRWHAHVEDSAPYIRTPRGGLENRRSKLEEREREGLDRSGELLVVERCRLDVVPAV